MSHPGPARRPVAWGAPRGAARGGARWAGLLVAAAVLALGACAGAGSDAAPAGTQAPPRKVTVAGDSISVGLGAALRGAVPGNVEVKVIGEDGTGLARPDTFDWPDRLATLARDFPPDVLVLSLGSNDAQDLRDASGTVTVPLADVEAWDAAYRERLAAAMDPFEDTGTTVVWVGHVRARDPQVGDVNRRIHRLAAEVAAERDWVEVADLAELLGTGEDVAARCLFADGVHLTVDCLDEAAAALVPTLPLS